MIKYYSHNILKIGLLITATQFLMASGCNKDSSKPCALVTPYSFNVTSEWTPQKLVYRIGDTIILNSSFPKTLLDQVTNSNINYSNSSNIQGDLSIALYDTITHLPVAGRDSFSIVTVTGSFVERTFNQQAGINFNYKETQGFYEFRGGFICKKKGIYGIGVSDLSSNGIVGEQCKNANFSMTVTNSDKHLFLNQYALNVNPNDPELVKRGYAFRVQ
jgi:hypothetical protein